MWRQCLTVCVPLRVLSNRIFVSQCSFNDFYFLDLLPGALVIEPSALYLLIFFFLIKAIHLCTSIFTINIEHKHVYIFTGLRLLVQVTSYFGASCFIIWFFMVFFPFTS